MITTILWPYALKSATLMYNEIHLDKCRLSPEMKFASATVKTSVSHRHPWGCPVFVLTDKAQNGKAPKWEPKSRVGIYLSHSPTHPVRVRAQRKELKLGYYFFLSTTNVSLYTMQANYVFLINYASIS